MNRREKIVKENIEKEGWTVLNRGWPDLLCFDEETGAIMFVEVKAPATKYEIRHDRPMGGIPTKCQRKMHDILRGAGFDVKVVHVK